MYLTCTYVFFKSTGKKPSRIIMAVNVDNCSSISSNCSNSTVMLATYDYSVCLIGFCIHAMVICIIILPLNIWALCLIRKTTVTNKGFASSDLLHFNTVIASVMLCVMFIICSVLTYSNISNNFLSCITYISAVIFSISLMAQVQFYTWICVEHYLAVVQPIVFFKLKQSLYKMVWVSFTWVTSTVFGGLCVLIQRKLALFLYIIPLCGLIVLILLCGVPTLAKLKKPNPGVGKRGEKMPHQKIKAFRVITLILIVLIFTYCPYICLAFFWYDIAPEIICTARTILISLLLPGAVLHSLLYISCFFKE